MSALKFILPLGVFVLIAIALGVGLTRDPSLIPSEMIDRELPTFELEALRDGEEAVSDASLKGEPALVNIFGSWCAACVVEHPMLMDIARRDDVRIVGINWRDSDEAALNWLARYGDPYELIAVDRESSLAIELGVTGAPETFVIDSEGRIRYKHIGPITEDVWREILKPMIDGFEAEPIS